MGSPLRILHVVVNMNRGGAETLLMNLYRNIDRSKVQFDFLTCRQGVFDNEIFKLGGRVHQIPYVTDIGPFGFNQALRKFFRTYPEYKIVHIHMDKMSGIVLWAAKKENVPVRIAHSHNTGSEGGVLTKAFKWLVGKFILSNATHYYACSQAAAAWLFKKKAEQAVILKNGIEIEKFYYSHSTRHTVRVALGIADDMFVLGHVGRFNDQKNHLFLLDVFAETVKRIPNSILLLVGDGIRRPKIEERIRALQLENKVMLLGMRNDTHALHQAFDLFVFPSLHEGLPVTLIEAQGAGLYCLISDRITEETDLKAGLIERIPLSNKAYWVDRICRLQQKLHFREVDTKALAVKGYDIRQTAKATQSAYIRLGEIR